MKSKVDESLTLTRTRCSGFGYWASTKGGRLSVYDFTLLQGFQPQDLPMKTIGVTPAQLAAALGNAQSLNVVIALLPRVLWLARVITNAEFKDMTRRAVTVSQ